MQNQNYYITIEFSVFFAQDPIVSLSHPGKPGDLLFLVHFRRRLCRRRSGNTFQLSGKTPKANFFKPHMVDLWVWEILLAPISVTLGQGH